MLTDNVVFSMKTGPKLIFRPRIGIFGFWLNRQ